ncbi:kinase-like protein [Peniophora sp. CONT]|nr:kinase-like protein [Peniophora sp. CONT]
MATGAVDIPEALTITFVIGEPVFGRARRHFTSLKLKDDGEFGTVYLCDWHSELPFAPELPTSRVGPGSRLEYQGMRIVAVKRMKRQWRGDECDWKRLREIQALCAISRHPNIVSLLDAFVEPDKSELCLLTRGISYIHASGYMHRDMLPENILITTVGLLDYPSLYDADARVEKDVIVMVKIADFGLVRPVASSPPYTEYVSGRWYRAPEVILKSHHYTASVDMWALGCITMELSNLRPLFAGNTDIDQMDKIVHVLGDPVNDHGIDDHDGVELGRQVGYTFSKVGAKMPDLVSPRLNSKRGSIFT